jgi:hypothetical protein
LALDFFGSFCVKTKKKVMFFIIELFRGLSEELYVIKVCWLLSREAALLETQLNFVPAFACFGRQAHMPCQAKDKIRLLIEKLGRKSVWPP